MQHPSIQLGSDRRRVPGGRAFFASTRWVGTADVASGDSQTRSVRGRVAAAITLWVGLFGEHRILTHASAIAFGALRALVPLALVGIALPGVLGIADFWDARLRPAVERQLEPTAFEAVDTAVRRIESDASGLLPVLAGALLVWYVAGLVRACTGGINAIHDEEDDRPLLRRWALSFAIAIGVIVVVVAAVLAFTVGPRLDRNGAGHVVLLLVRWPVAILLLGLAVSLLVHFAPAGARKARWASVGAAVVVTAWIAQSLVFAWFVDSLANFKSATGALIVFLVLAAYLYVASVIFLVGAQIDELLRKDASEHETGLVGVLAGASPTEAGA